MVVTDLINLIDFKFCPRCGSQNMVRTKTLGDKPHNVLKCLSCHKTYYIGLEPDIC